MEMCCPILVQPGQCEEEGACAALGLEAAAQQMAGYSEIEAAARDQVLLRVLHVFLCRRLGPLRLLLLLLV